MNTWNENYPIHEEERRPMKRYCPKCENEVKSQSWDIYDCPICEKQLFESEVDNWKGQTKGKPLNVIEWIITNGYAKNIFQASHIANGLKLAQISDQPDEQQKRVRLYRAWRPKKKSKRDELPSWQAYELAIAGINPDDVEPRQDDKNV